MHKCTLCHKELEDDQFYPSNLKRHLYQCKKCVYEKYTKRSTKKYNDSIRNYSDEKFNQYYGGYVVAILNHIKKNEYKYTIKGTDGYMIQTNDIEYFKKKMDEICQGLKLEK